jgi:hypothetical protein
VAEGQIPAMPSSDFTTRNEGKRQIRPKTFNNCISTNIVTRQSRINKKRVKVPEAKSEQYKNSFFVRTAIDWNNIEDNIGQTKTKLLNLLLLHLSVCMSTLYNPC